jgi:tRNA/rRNA methyltransferase
VQGRFSGVVVLLRADSEPVKINKMPPDSEFDRLQVVLVGTRNPLNIGAAARAMSNFGFRRLRVVRPYAPAFREARSAVGAGEVLANAEEFDTVAQAVADCAQVVGTTAVRNRELQHRVWRPEAGARRIRTALAGAPAAILFGSEKVGLSNDDLSHCHWLMRIPTREEHISMNLGQAVAVCLYEIVRDARAARTITKRQPATSSELERITQVLLQALRASGYVKSRSGDSADAAVRRLVRRLNLDADDAELWLGMLRQMLWKIKQTA